MHRIASGLCVAAAFTFAASLGAQTPTTTAPQTPTTSASGAYSHDKEVTVTGCLQRGADGNYMLTNAMVEPERAGTSTTGTTGTSTGSSTATGSSTMGSTAGSAAASTWALEGGSDLDKHVGHKIQVTGDKMDSSRKDEATSTTAGTSGTTATGSATGSTATGTSTGTTGSQMSSRSEMAHGSKLDVKSVKMIASSCS